MTKMPMLSELSSTILLALTDIPTGQMRLHEVADHIALALFPMFAAAHLESDRLPSTYDFTSSPN